MYMATKLNRVCRDLSAWGKQCGLTFNPNKTIAMLFTHSNQTYKKFKSHKLIKMDSIAIGFSETVKYLGLTLDRKLNWKAHIEDKMQTCKKLMLFFFFF